MVIGLHGCTQSPDALRDRGHWESAAEAHGAVIALPRVPNGGVIAGCWDYYGQAHTRTNRHNGALIDLAGALAADASLGIDSDQIYIAGLSSGASQAAVVACLAPDVFAGVGINAGPTIGTEASQISTVSTDASTAVALCRRWAGAHAAHLQTQAASIVGGTRDFLVSQGYLTLNAEVLAELYGAQPPPAELDVTSLAGHQPRGRGRVWSDPRGPRVALIEAEGMGHAFPAGSGPGPEIEFVASEGVSWPAFLLDFLSSNNRRIAGAVPPPVDAGTNGRTDAGSTDAGSTDGAGAADATSSARADGAAATPARGGAPEGGCECSQRRRSTEGGATSMLALVVAAIAGRRRRPG